MSLNQKVLQLNRREYLPQATKSELAEFPNPVGDRSYRRISYQRSDEGRQIRDRCLCRGREILMYRTYDCLRYVSRQYRR